LHRGRWRGSGRHAARERAVAVAYFRLLVLAESGKSQALQLPRPVRSTRSASISQDCAFPAYWLPIRIEKLLRHSQAVCSVLTIFFVSAHGHTHGNSVVLRKCRVRRLIGVYVGYSRVCVRDDRGKAKRPAGALSKRRAPLVRSIARTKLKFRVSKRKFNGCLRATRLSPSRAGQKRL
jgi:hypothetical protein